jgi:hypothetical protein
MCLIGFVGDAEWPVMALTFRTPLLASQDRSRKEMYQMLFKVAVGALLIVAVVGPLQACPVKKLAHVTREPLRRYTKLELAVRDVRTGEGGLWRIYFRHDGVPHSIVRIDFGETRPKTNSSIVCWPA